MKNNFGPLTVALAINSCAMNELQSSKKKGKISEKSKFRESFIEESIRSKLLANFYLAFRFRLQIRTNIFTQFLTYSVNNDEC